MRIIILALALSSLPASALALCGCGCVEGQAVARCTQPTDIPPLCQIVCMPSVQPPPVNLPGGPSSRSSGLLEGQGGGGGSERNPLSREQQQLQQLFTPQR